MNSSLTKTLTAAAVALSGLTFAYAGPAPMDKNPVAAPVPCNWQGFYIGINGGVAGLEANITDEHYVDSGATSRLEDTNVTVGGQLGYNWQRNAFVFGLELDGDYLNTERSYTGYYGGYRGDMDFQGSLRPRLGIAVENALIYVTGGAAISHGSDRYGFFPGTNYTDPTNPYYRKVAEQDNWQVGFVGGVGTEYKLNCSWSVRLEALWSHYPESGDYATRNFNRGNDNWPYRFQNDVYSLRVGVNYLFGGGR